MDLCVSHFDPDWPEVSGLFLRDVERSCMTNERERWRNGDAAPGDPYDDVWMEKNRLGATSATISTTGSTGVGVFHFSSITGF